MTESEYNLKVRGQRVIGIVSSQLIQVECINYLFQEKSNRVFSLLFAKMLNSVKGFVI